ncbi:MAG TPA: LysR substrate-binding domain-containing protein [Steroidobacteraceae bacterium]|nr:LysR substrate-binding domain-containing protein [Steroidobacteraceae bacterium]
MLRLSRPPPLRNLRAFCVAARQRSFKLAADELCLTPSAVSHQMKELETLFGMRLFERKTRSLELTLPGHHLLEEVEPLLEALDRTLAQFARRHRRQTLRVRLPALFANELFIPRLGEFCEAHPSIDVQLDTRDPRPASHPPTADVSILLADAAPLGMKSVRLFSCPFTAVCARQHASLVARLGREVFSALPLIVDRTRPFAWSSWAEEVGLASPEPKQMIELDTMIAVVRAAERGLGIALVPTLLCDSWIRSGALVRVFGIELSTADAYYLVSRPKDADRPPVKALTHWAVSQYQAA